VAGVTFVAAGVEWVEALTIVLAVGIVRGWRSAFTGTVAAVVVLAAMVAVFGLALQTYLPLVRTLIGVFLLLFGLKWLHKAILRSAGLKPLHDEAKAFVATEEGLRTAKSHWAGIATAFNGVLLEGLEVVFIVVAIGGLNQNDYLSPILGAATSVIVVVGVGVAARRPLTQVPENTLKYVVGIMLTAFGTFFAGEGIGVKWPGSDLIILALAVGYGLASLLFVLYLRLPLRRPGEAGQPLRLLRAAWTELYGLFVDDSALAIITIAALLAVALFAQRFNTQLAGLLLVAGVLLAMVISLSGPARARAAK
jgi:Ca2+/H+ antiporter, TMEM165/GDT1 family